MQQVQVALIRGINVGKAKRIAMAELRALFESLGFRDVRTLLNSGNVVYRSGEPASKAAARIETALSERIGSRTRAVILTARELGTVVSENSLVEIGANHSRLLVAVPSKKSLIKDLTPLAARDWTPEAIALGSRAAYLWCPGGIIDSSVGTAMNRALGDAVTARNWATILKLQALTEDR
ncbi:MAG: DUF1697 domain-containing protein [Thermoanaerobaculia bacterium]